MDKAQLQSHLIDKSLFDEIDMAGIAGIAKLQSHLIDKSLFDKMQDLQEWL